MKVRPAKSLCGRIALPGDKSISHRAAMIAALAEGETQIEDFATSADCASTLACLEGLGVKIQRQRENCIVIDGVGKTGLSEAKEPLDYGNSGTTMRLMAGILAGQAFGSTLTGDDSLRNRPMQRIIEPLSAMGAEIRSEDGRAPFTITGGKPLTGIEYHPPHASAQVKSCVLFAALNASGRTTIVESVKTRDHTERMLAWFGADLDCTETSVCISGNAVLRGRDFTVPGDISSAAFFMIAAACLPGSDITLPSVGVNPSRRAIIDALYDLGADIKLTEENEICNEPVATIRIRGGMSSARTKMAAVLCGRTIANLIDEIPIIAVCATQLERGIEVRDAAELRVKESDRIAAVVENLRRMGARVTEFPDGFRVDRSDLHGAQIDSYGDHRIAMAFAVAGLFADGETEIQGAECAAVSFPGFFETLSSVVKSVTPA